MVSVQSSHDGVEEFMLSKNDDSTSIDWIVKIQFILGYIFQVLDLGLKNIA